MIKPLVSIIALCYNQADFLVETLDSINNQTYSNIELIIIDDCSADNSVEVIQTWIALNNYDCAFISHKKNQGICKTLNEALEMINGDFYQGVACDDILSIDKISTQVDLFNTLDASYSVIFSDAYLIDSNSSLLYGKFIQRYKPKLTHIPSGDILDDLLISNYIPAMSVLLRTQCVKNLGGYDENLSYEDYDLWLRISRHHKFYFSNYISGKYRLHNNNMHATRIDKKEQLIDNFHILRKHKDLTIAKEKLNHIVFKMYTIGLHKNFKTEILSLDLESNVIFFIKYNVPYKIFDFLAIRLKKLFLRSNS